MSQHSQWDQGRSTCLTPLLFTTAPPQDSYGGLRHLLHPQLGRNCSRRSKHEPNAPGATHFLSTYKAPLRSRRGSYETGTLLTLGAASVAQLPRDSFGAFSWALVFLEGDVIREVFRLHICTEGDGARDGTSELSLTWSVSHVFFYADRWARWGNHS